MSVRFYDVQARILEPYEVQEARLALNLSRRGLAEILLLSPENGHARVQRWEEGSERISAQSSQCIRLWLHVRGLGPLPPWPDDRPAGGMQQLPGVLQEAVHAGLVSLRLAWDIAEAMTTTGKKAFEIVGETGDPPLPTHTYRLLSFLKEREPAGGNFPGQEDIFSGS